MSTTITLELPDEALQRYQRGADAAHKKLEEFLVERLMEVPLFLAETSPSPLAEELGSLEKLDDAALWDIAQSHLSSEQQTRYDELLQKNSAGELTTVEGEELSKLGECARYLTLKKAHAYMLLKWRGHTLPSPETWYQTQSF